ncbi:MAG: hypothetical protein ACI9C1_003324, partial [Candidatus Aldehydirespiratoraceae bacterium]
MLVPWELVTDVTDSVSSAASGAADRLADDAQQASAERAFSKSLAVSAMRCTLTYVLIPFVFPIIGFG